MTFDPEIRAHKEWLGFLQPVGLVVSPPALSNKGAIVNHSVVDIQQTLLKLVRRDKPRVDMEEVAWLPDFREFAQQVLGWEEGDLVGTPPSLVVDLREYNETLAPSYAVPYPGKQHEWMLVVKALPQGWDLDDPGADQGQNWHASPQAKFERLLREKEIPVGVLFNGVEIRLVYAPRGESSGHVTFPVQAMTEVSGRLILGALHMLLCADRLFTISDDRKLPALLAESRKYQNLVSTKLAEQILFALNELLRGFQAADEVTKGRILGEVSRDDPQHIYGGLLTTLLRLVFLLYAEDRGLMPKDPVYAGHYSVTGLYDRLREDAGRYPDTMDQRYGAWAWLISLFRMVFDGGAHGGLHLPARNGELFDPDEYPFLEGRPYKTLRSQGDRLEPPRVSDGVIYKVLESLLVLEGERLSYRALDVEQIGSVYEAMMGFEVKRAEGPSIGVTPHHVVVNVQELLDTKPAERAKKLKEEAGCDVKGDQLKTAKTTEDVVAAFGRKVSPRTPRLLPPGSLFLQPGQERRRSGSHYTPRILTEPIVKTTLRPILEALGERPKPEQILALKVCDPAMGSGAFLVETCRHLGDRLVKAWQDHNCQPAIPPDEDPILHARRLVAQQCLYGVDKNPFAVNLAKLSLWLVTLAKDHPFTFLDHVLKHGDSLVGLSREQIASFHWKPDQQVPLLHTMLRDVVDRVGRIREQLHALPDEEDIKKRRLWREAEDALDDARLVGDAAVTAFFSGESDKTREAARKKALGIVEEWRSGKATAKDLRDAIRDAEPKDRKLVPFHWEVEFPEVFPEDNLGFDAFVGNPPFLGGKRISTLHGKGYKGWLAASTPEASGNTDLVGFFFRRCFGLTASAGCLGLLATKTIAQGDTRKGALRWLGLHGGVIFDATRSFRWPGQAAVVVSAVHVAKHPKAKLTFRLDGRTVEKISTYLLDKGGDADPHVLSTNKDRCFIGCDLKGHGFLFSDGDREATPIAEMVRLTAHDPRNGQVIHPYLGCEEVNQHPTHQHRRYVIDFTSMSEEEACGWRDLASLVKPKILRERTDRGNDVAAWPWWRFWRERGELRRAIRGLSRMLVVGCGASSHLAPVFLPTSVVCGHTLAVIALEDYAGFGVLQSRVHEVWARLFSSTFGGNLRYTPSTCFTTFPFPQDRTPIHDVACEYYTYRAALLERLGVGLTKLYNEFHCENNQTSEILRLRDLHNELDRVVLSSYGWPDLAPQCEFTAAETTIDEEEEEDLATVGHDEVSTRYAWNVQLTQAVLARLLELNRQRAEEERLAGLTAQAEPKTKKARSKKSTEGDLPLFPTRKNGS